MLTRGYAGLPSEMSDNISCVFGLTGFITRIEVPAIRNLLELGSIVNIQEAELVIYPVINTYNEYFNLPENLSLYIADETNTIVDAVTTSYGTVFQQGNLVADDFFPMNTQYSFTITDFLKEEINAIGINKRKLILTLPDSDMNTTMKSVIFGNQAHTSQNVKLNVICTIYE